MSLQILEGLPSGMVDLPAPRLYEVLDGPTLIEIKGDRDPGVFVSVLLHGNEVGGWDAVRGLLKSLEGRSPQRAISLFVGNVQAAKAGVKDAVTVQQSGYDYHVVTPDADNWKYDKRLY